MSQLTPLAKSPIEKIRTKYAEVGKGWLSAAEILTIMQAVLFAMISAPTHPGGSLIAIVLGIAVFACIRLSARARKKFFATLEAATVEDTLPKHLPFPDDATP